MLYTENIVTVNGNCVEEFWFLNNNIVASRVKYEGKNHADAEANLMAFWHPPVKHSIPHTIGIL